MQFENIAQTAVRLAADACSTASMLSQTLTYDPQHPQHEAGLAGLPPNFTAPASAGGVIVFATMPPDASGPLDRFLVRLPSAHEAEQAAGPCSSGEPAQHLQQRPSSPAGQPQPQCSTSGFGIDGPPGDCSCLSQQLAAASHSQRRCAQNLPCALRQSQLLGRKPLSAAQYIVQEAKAQRMVCCEPDTMLHVDCSALASNVQSSVVPFAVGLHIISLTPHHALARCSVPFTIPVI